MPVPVPPPSSPQREEGSITKLLGLIAGSAAVAVLALFLSHDLPVELILVVGTVVPVTCLLLIVREVVRLLHEDDDNDPTSF